MSGYDPRSGGPNGGAGRGRPDDERIAAVLRRALEREAATVVTSGDGLERIRARTQRNLGWRGWMKPVAVTAAAMAVVAGGVGIGVGVLGGRDEAPVAVSPPEVGPTTEPATEPAVTPPPAEPTVAPEPSPTGSGEGAAARTVTVPVYYVGDTPFGLRLYREFHRMSTTRSDAEAAVEEMLRAPDDPDYATPWNPATAVRSVRRDGGGIVVDLSAAAREASVGAEAAERAVQQLVYTVTAALQADVPVTILVEGAPAGELWGHVVVDQPLRRADPLATRALVQINEPAQGAAVGRSFRVSGEGAFTEATLVWRLLDGEVEVAGGSGMSEECCRLAPYAFDVTAPAPGRYTLVVEQTDDSGGAEGPGPYRDTKTVTVR